MPAGRLTPALARPPISLLICLPFVRPGPPRSGCLVQGCEAVPGPVYLGQLRIPNSRFSVAAAVLLPFKSNSGLTAETMTLPDCGTAQTPATLSEAGRLRQARTSPACRRRGSFFAARSVLFRPRSVAMVLARLRTWCSAQSSRVAALRRARRVDLLGSVSGRPAPEACQPWLLFARQAGRAIIVGKLGKARGRQIAPPACEVVIGAVASPAPAFLVAPMRIRAE
jgi:hypothetical protein